MTLKTRRRVARATRLRWTAWIAPMLLVCALPAASFGATLQNPGFENGLIGWQAEVQPSGGAPAPATCSVPQRDVCLINGSDSFDVTEGSTTRTVTVAPLDGTKMVRLGGPFHSADENQTLGEQYILRQAVTVDPADPIIHLNYNVFTYDYTGFDSLHLSVRVTDSSGAEIASKEQGAFGSGTQLKTTGWQPVSFDLSGYAGQSVDFNVTLQGTKDDLFGFWGYLDAGQPPPTPNAGASAPAQAPDGQPGRGAVADGSRLRT